MTWIDNRSGLAQLVARLRPATRFALDTEANAFHAYRPRLCLIQIGWEEGDQFATALIDPLALTGELGELAELLAGGRPVVMHGADYDVRLLRRDAAIAIGKLFDTQVAARVLGLPRTALSALAEQFVGLQLDKSQQTFDWGTRPLPERARRYAAEDVAPLFVLADRFATSLAELGRQEWVAQICERLRHEQAAEALPVEPNELLSKLKEARQLSPQERTALAALLTWREAEAARRDRPAFKICDGRALVPIAREAVQGGVGAPLVGPSWLIGRFGGAMRRALDEALQGPPLPPTRREPARPPTPIERSRLLWLKRLRERQAAALAIEPGLLAPGVVLEQLAKEPVRQLSELSALGLLPWQLETAGPTLLEALAAAERGENPPVAVSSLPSSAAAPLPPAAEENGG